MAKDNAFNSENILVKVDQNNLVYIDPNSVIDKDGNIQPRDIKQENLVMYANLEADIIPRSILAATNDQNTLLSIAKGTINFLRNQNGREYNTSWTDAYLSDRVKYEKQTENGKEINVPNEIFSDDTSSQSFGIDGITISIKGANAIPQVNISFIDVRGKTLFSESENSPYNAFFHLPWPIFYLTLKGFYGKAIRYRLHLVKFSSKFNDSNGNFEVSTTFVGSTFAFLNDISLKAIMNAPYMFPIESTKTAQTNENTQNSLKDIYKSSKGYSILKNIYSEYKKKGLVDSDFQDITLRELIVKAQSLDKLLEREILYQKLHPDIFIGLQDYENAINNFREQVIAWGKKNLKADFDPETINNETIRFYKLKDNSNESVLGDNKEGKLEYIIKVNNERLLKSKLFSDELIKDSSDKKTGGVNFSKEKLLAKTIDKIEKYSRKNNNTFQVNLDGLVNDINEINKVFQEQKKVLQDTIEKEMNNIIKDKKLGGLGFEPTIRNMFAVILANADVYIRLMKDVHETAFKQSETRKKLLNSLSKETKGDPAIYPWPEVKKDAEDKKSRVIAYPGDPTLTQKLQSNNSVLWPEVYFVENFMEVSTNKIDPLAEKENTVDRETVTYPNDDNQKTTTLISSLDYISNSLTYIDRTLSAFFYEIYERANYFTLIDTFNTNSLNDLVKIEFENISSAVKEDLILTTRLKNITDYQTFINALIEFSPNERYPYYQDQLPTTPYIKSALDSPFEISEFNQKNKNLNNTDLNKLSENLKTYISENYRRNIYPFNSQTYLGYLGLQTFDNQLSLNNVLSVNTTDGFITSPNKPNSWIKSNFVNKDNVFSNKLKINNTNVSILDTPYFHKQLLNDFNKTSAYGRYAGSTYLLLTSLPFIDLEDTITLPEAAGPVRLSSLFREVGATHFIPYHLICKWGAIYHRYKKNILEGEDILDGFLNINNKTTPINGSETFNNNETSSQFTGFTISANTVTYTGNVDVGIHPYYDAVFHQVVNGYTHYDVLSGNTSFSFNVDQKAINCRLRKQSNGLNYWTSYVDNSKFDSTDNRFTILPCDGSDSNINRVIIPNLITGAQINLNIETFDTATQNYFKILWEDSLINDRFEDRLFPTHDQYFRTYSTNQRENNLYAIGNDYKKVIDLIATFSPKILEDFENIFLDFATERFSDGRPDQRFPNVKYTNFQNLLKEICSVKKEQTDVNLSTEQIINAIKERQQTKLNDVTFTMLSTQNMLKFTLANPKEIDSYVWHGFADVDNLNTFSYDGYFDSQVTDDNKKLIKLYLGEDMDSHYQNFFEVNDVALNETNILQFRPLIQIYAGYAESGQPANMAAFKTYIRNIYGSSSGFLNFSGATNRKNYFLTQLIRNFSKLPDAVVNGGTYNPVSGYETDKVKLELYNYFKSFNDKWVAGNSLGQRLLLEEFLFFDKANKDIGNELFLNLDRLIQLGKQDFDKINLYSIISILIQGTGIDMRPLPSYINFYGNNLKTKNKITPSKKVATNLFGTFLDVDYEESTPKIILQLVGNTSKHLDIINKKYKFADDSFNIAESNKNPLIILPEVFRNVDLSKSNRVVAFEVSFGDQNQGIFKGVQLDQTSIKNTTESFIVLENLARSESGAGAYNVDISLFDYYRQASYTCDVTCMGNVMIQPTMFFYLKNIPMFKGSYWITEVSHQIRNNNFTTTFKGTRIPYSSLPDPKDSFVSSYRVLFDKLRESVVKKQTLSATGSINIGSSVSPSDGKTYNFNIGQEAFGEDFEKIKVNKAGITEFGVAYNGFENSRDIQLVKYAAPGKSQEEWLRARVFEYGSNTFFVDDTKIMTIATSLSAKNPVLWSEIKNTSKNQDFYSLPFIISSKLKTTYEKITSAKTIFINPELPQQQVTVISSVTGNVGNRIVAGPIDTSIVTNFGIGLSSSLMKKLKLAPGNIVYFQMI
jgi:hypothetical protein